MNTATKTRKDNLSNTDAQPFEAGDYGPRRPRAFFEKLFLNYMDGEKDGVLRLEYPQTREMVRLGAGKDDDFAADAVIRVVDESFFKKSVLFGEVGFGEAYVDKLWDTPDLYAVLNFFLRNAERTPTFAGASGNVRELAVNLLGAVNRRLHNSRRNTKANSRKNISEHYDLSNDFFSLMLDETMAYSSGIFTQESDDLRQSQLNKFESLCKRLQLSADDHLLEIGTGWGGMAMYAAENYGCRVTTVTISREQYEFAREKVRAAGLRDRIDVQLRDYREITGQFDKIVSVEMVEALGYEYFDTFFAKCASVLKPEGIMAIQCITFPEPYFKKYLKHVDWIQIHIFPGSLLLSPHEIMNSLERTSDLMIWEMESIGLHYAKTLRLWRENILENRERLEEMGFDDHFMRKWLYYLIYCEVGFANRYINDVQLVFSRPLNSKLENPRGRGFTP